MIFRRLRSPDSRVHRHPFKQAPYTCLTTNSSLSKGSTKAKQLSPSLKATDSAPDGDKAPQDHGSACGSRQSNALRLLVSGVKLHPGKRRIKINLRSSSKAQRHGDSQLGKGHLHHYQSILPLPVLPPLHIYFPQKKAPKVQEKSW